MREILFRGKRKDNGEWVEGYYVCVGGKYHYILTGQIDLMSGYPRFIYCEVIPETVGQYTGLADKYGKKIFEGDIVKHYNHTDNPEKYEIYRVEFWQRTCKFVGRLNDNWYAQLAQHIEKHYEVIGNIHDNPELVKGV